MNIGKRRPGWLGNLAKLVVACVVVLIMFRWFEQHQIYYPTRELEVDAESRRLFEDVNFRARDGVELNGWLFAAEKNSSRASWAFLICHGNGGNISHRLELCRTLLAETGVNVFVFDYRGYGRSGGRAGEEGTYLDAQAAHAWLRERGLSNIIAYGESLGGAVAAELALRENLAGLVLQSAFTSIPDIGSEFYPWLPVRLLSTIKYDTRSKLPRIRVPVLIMHSREDGLVRFHHAEKNFAAANEPKLLCELRGDHNDATWWQPKFREAIAQFLNLAQEYSQRRDAPASHP
jgi:fermentation-respiration switch protein FrsA (DUF1100 family)